MVKKCVACGGQFSHDPNFPGRPPIRCMPCRAKARKARNKTTPIDPDAAEARRANIRALQQTLIGDRSPDVEEQSKAYRLAVMLPAHKSRRAAGLAAGMDLSEPELDKLEALARELYPDIVAGKLTGYAGHATRALALGVQKFLDTMHLISPRDMPGAVRNIAQVRESLVGLEGPKHTYTSLTLVFGDQDDNARPVEPLEVMPADKSIN